MFIKWEDSYSVGNEEIDNQHKKILDLLNTLVEGLKEERFEQELKTAIKDLIDYSNYHFQTEEDLFKKYKYKNAKDHIAKHNDFRATIMKLSQDYMENQKEACLDLVDFLEDWFIDHINGTDKRYMGVLK